MDDALVMGGAQRIGDLPSQRQHLGHGERATRDPICQGSAVHQLQDQESRRRGLSRCFLDAVDGGDVRMVQRGKHLRLALEPRDAIRVASGGGQRLDGDVASEPGVVSAVDLAHAAGANLRGDFVGPESCAGGEQAGGL